MCTLVLAWNVFDGHPVVVAANRDERLSRPSELPAIRPGLPSVLAPKDLERHGAWNGVNAAGVFVGLTNRLGVATVRGRKSRGMLVMEALAQTSAQAACDLIRKEAGAAHSGFYLVVADRLSAHFVHGDGERIATETLSPGTWFITNHGTNLSELPHARRVQNAARAWHEHRLTDGPPMPERLRRALDVHDEQRYGTCLQEPEKDYGTKSSSVITLDADGWTYWHRERASADRHICDEPFALMPKLAIVS